MLTQQTLEKLRALRLTGMAEALVAQRDQPDMRQLDFEERLGLLVDHESTYRENRRLARLLRDAKLRQAASLEDIDYTAARGLDRATMRHLATGEWIQRGQNVLVTGPTGVGKTFIVCALAHTACLHGFRTRYYRVSRLLSEVTLAKGDGSYSKLLKKLSKTDVLVLDDWGISTLAAVEARDILDIIDDRDGPMATVVASQLPIDAWHAVIADPTVGDAILDRLIHHAHKLVLKGESMRKRNKMPDGDTSKDAS